MERSGTTSQATTGSDFTSKASGIGEDVKKKLRFLSEVVPDGTVKRSLAASFAIFLAKKMAESEGFEPSIILLVKSRLKDVLFRLLNVNFSNFNIIWHFSLLEENPP